MPRTDLPHSARLWSSQDAPGEWRREFLGGRTLSINFKFRGQLCLLDPEKVWGLPRGQKFPIAGFGSFAVCWIGSTLNAYRYILIGNKLAHGDWVIRSYALTLTGVTFGFSLPLLEAAGVEYETAYQVSSWLSWLPNLLLAEWMVRVGQPRPPAAPKRIGKISNVRLRVFS